VRITSLLRAGAQRRQRARRTDPAVHRGEREPQTGYPDAEFIQNENDFCAGGGARVVLGLGGAEAESAETETCLSRESRERWRLCRPPRGAPSAGQGFLCPLCAALRERRLSASRWYRCLVSLPVGVPSAVISLCPLCAAPRERRPSASRWYRCLVSLPVGVPSAVKSLCRSAPHHGKGGHPPAADIAALSHSPSGSPLR